MNVALRAELCYKVLEEKKEIYKTLAQDGAIAWGALGNELQGYSSSCFLSMHPWLSFPAIYITVKWPLYSSDQWM